MLVLYDWECDGCGAVQEHALSVETGSPVSSRAHELWLDCRYCKGEERHERLFPRPQHYTKAKITTQQSGGKYDTMGMAPVDPLPRLKPGQPLKELVVSKEYQDVKKRRKEQHENNLAKRERARLMRAGADIDLRVDKLPGDHPFIRE